MFKGNIILHRSAAPLLIEFRPVLHNYTVKQNFSPPKKKNSIRSSGGDPEIRRVLRAALDEDTAG